MKWNNNFFFQLEIEIRKNKIKIQSGKMKLVETCERTTVKIFTDRDRVIQF